MSERDMPSPESGAPLDPGAISEMSLVTEQNRQIDAEVKAALGHKIKATYERELPTGDSYTFARTVSSIEARIGEAGFDSEHTEVVIPNRKNPQAKNADLTFNVGGIAKRTGLSHEQVTADIVSRLADVSEVADSEVAGSFVNLRLDLDQFAPRIFEEIARLGDDYGKFRDGNPQLIIIDYSSPNVAKNMTVAHLRSTIIGQALMNIHEAAGDIVFGINHIGDWGTQFGNILYQYQKELAVRGKAFMDELNANPAGTLMRIYRDFNKHEAKNPHAVAAGQALFLRLEQGEPGLVELWKQFRAWSLQDFEPTYRRLGIHFDAVQGENFYEDRMQPTVEEAVQSGVLRPNQEGSIVFPAQPLVDPTTGRINGKAMADTEGQPRDEIIVKPSGGTVYLTRDLAAIKYRSQELGADKILYVIGKEQTNHCLELFAMADQMDYMPLGSAEHISFGHLTTDGKKMSSREGKIVLLNELLDEAILAATDFIQQRKRESGNMADLTEDELEVARMVGVGAVIFNDLKQSREKDIQFNADIAKTLEAGSSTYVQYTHSRLNSILAKLGEPEDSAQVPETVLDSERMILVALAAYPQVVKEAAQKNAPHRISTYLTEVCQLVNNFYHESPIAKADSSTEKNFRLSLVKSAQQVIRNASQLIHLELPERM